MGLRVQSVEFMGFRVQGVSLVEFFRPAYGWNNPINPYQRV